MRLRKTRGPGEEEEEEEEEEGRKTSFKFVARTQLGDEVWMEALKRDTVSQ